VSDSDAASVLAILELIEDYERERTVVKYEPGDA
jgi:hypothetical protein